MGRNEARAVNSQIIIFSFVVMFISRIYATTTNRNLLVNPVLISAIYMIIIFYFGTDGLKKLE